MGIFISFSHVHPFLQMPSMGCNASSNVQNGIENIPPMISIIEFLIFYKK